MADTETLEGVEASEGQKKKDGGKAIEMEAQAADAMIDLEFDQDDEVKVSKEAGLQKANDVKEKISGLSDRYKHVYEIYKEIAQVAGIDAEELQAAQSAHSSVLDKLEGSEDPAGQIDILDKAIRTVGHSALNVGAELIIRELRGFDYGSESENQRIVFDKYLQSVQEGTYFGKIHYDRGSPRPDASPRRVDHTPSIGPGRSGYIRPAQTTRYYGDEAYWDTAVSFYDFLNRELEVRQDGSSSIWTRKERKERKEENTSVVKDLLNILDYEKNSLRQDLQDARDAVKKVPHAKAQG